jgi:hypothetical protein
MMPQRDVWVDDVEGVWYPMFLSVSKEVEAAWQRWKSNTSCGPKVRISMDNVAHAHAVS